MSFQQKPNQGALFKNDKQGVESRPDYNGKLNVDGKDYWVSGWVKDGKSGKFLSLAVKPAQSKAPEAAQPGGGGVPPIGRDFDEIPFNPL